MTGCHRLLGKETARGINERKKHRIVKGDWLKSRVREIRTHGSVRGVKLFYKAE
jgi:hypothetical protein